MKDEKPILRLKGPRPLERAPRAPGRRVVPLTKRPAEEVILADLQAIAPQVWDPAKPAPLAVGIHAQINPVAEARGLSRRSVRRFLGGWTSRPAYLCALCQPDALRVNVDGSGAEAVLERHRDRARRRLERRAAPAGEAAQARGCR